MIVLQPYTSAELQAACALIELSRERPMVTRFQERQIRRTFPFLKLPGEIRNMIYELCFDVTAAEKLLDRYYHFVNQAFIKDPNTKIRDLQAPLIYSKCSPIFLLNRQIYSEASFLVRKRGLHFGHGLLDLEDINDFMRPSLVRSVSSLTIDDSGHPLIRQLADILSKAGTTHHLKSLTIALTSGALIPHLDYCLNSHLKCGFRDALLDVVARLRHVHNVGHVTLVGFPAPIAQDLKACMEGPAIGFLDLPQELRDEIYGHAADWSDISRKLNKTMANWVDKSKKPPYPQRTVPTILRLNRQIAGEALHVLRKKPLVIACPGDHNMTTQSQVPNLLQFIRATTLHHVQHLVLKIESWEWIYSLDKLLPTSPNKKAICAPKPTSSSSTAVVGVENHFLSLKTLHLHFRDVLKPKFCTTPHYEYPDEPLHLALSRLKNFRGLSKVTFSGDLPKEYTEPLAQIMQMSPSVAAADLPVLKAIRSDGAVVAIVDDDEYDE
jgi:hypothetical protein